MYLRNAARQKRLAGRVRPVALASMLLFFFGTVSALSPQRASAQRFLGIRSMPEHLPAKIVRHRVEPASSQAAQETTIAEAIPRSALSAETFLESGCETCLEPSCQTCLQPCCSPILARLATGRFYGRGEVLSWWTDGMDIPPLVTTSPASAPPEEIGVLGASGTTVLFGESGINDGGKSGGRFTLGFHPHPCYPWKVEATYAFLGRDSTFFGAASPETPVIARPFRNVATLAQDAVQIAFPGELDGSIAIDSSTEFQSFELVARRALAHRCSLQVDFLVGYRHVDLDDQLQIADSITTQVAFPPTAPIIPEGTNLSGIDRFDSSNSFDGAQLGFSCRVARCRWSAELMTKLALGNTSSEVFIDGSTTITLPGAGPTTEPGSKLALPSNMGRYERDSFSMVPELMLRLDYQISPCWNASLAYTFVYWSHVARAGNQIDLDIDENQFPLPNLPAGDGIWPEFRFDFDDFWAQGLSLGLERRF